MNYFKVYKMEIAAKLMLRKFVLQGLSEDEKNPRFKVFLFKDSEELRKAINEITKK